MEIPNLPSATMRLGMRTAIEAAVFLVACASMPHPNPVGGRLLFQMWAGDDSGMPGEAGLLSQATKGHLHSLR